MLWIPHIQIRTGLKAFNAVPSLPSLLVNSVWSKPWWILSRTAQYILHHLLSSARRTEQLILAWPTQYPISLDTGVGHEWVHDPSRPVGETNHLSTGGCKDGRDIFGVISGHPSWHVGKAEQTRAKMKHKQYPRGSEPVVPTSLLSAIGALSSSSQIQVSLHFFLLKVIWVKFCHLQYGGS